VKSKRVIHQLIIPRRVWCIIVSIFSILPTQGQIGGLATFDFLNLASSARSTALAGLPIAIADDDVAQGFNNPALINNKMSHHLTVNHNFHFADISHGFAAYSLTLDSAALSLMLGLNYVNYGDFTRADAFGNRNGTFSGAETAMIVGVSKKLDERLRVGVNIKYASARLEAFGASGLGADLGFHYYNPEKQTNWALVAKNMGAQLFSFSQSREAFPFDLQLGYAKRLEHLPFRFMITAHHLQRWDLRSPLDDESGITIIGQVPQPPSSFSKFTDNLFRHLAFGGELLIGRNEVFRLRFGYNHLRKKELSVDEFKSLSGLSFGFGFKVKKIQFDYGVGRFHLAGAVNHLSISMDLQSLFNKL